MSRPPKLVMVVVVCLITGIGTLRGETSPAHRNFTVADDIEAVHFGDPYLGQLAPITFSPDGKYVVVAAERGSLADDRPISTLKIYRMEDLRQWLNQLTILTEPRPFWEFNRSTYKDGPVITHVRWLADGTGFAFLQKAASGLDQLFLANLAKKQIDPLTPEDQFVTSFDIRDKNHIVYTVLTPAIQEDAAREKTAPVLVGTGRSLYSVFFPDDLQLLARVYDRSELWAVLDGKRFRVDNKDGGSPFSIHVAGQRSLALSPDGLSLVTAVTVGNIPPDWTTLYPSSSSSDAYRIRTGEQDPNQLSGWSQVSEYVLIALKSGEARSITHAPIADVPAGWLSLPGADWSADGKSLVLASTFVASDQSPGTSERKPCVVVVVPEKNSSTCVEELKRTDGSDSAAGFRSVEHVSFASGQSRRIIVDYSSGGANKSVAYVLADNGEWTKTELASGEFPIDISVRQSLNDPPVLVGTDSQTKNSRVIWNPNPQFSGIRMGVATVFKWKDKSGRDWQGALFKPPDYDKERRYPLVIQTHGFSAEKFEPSGVYPTAFAARELAAFGMLVLQIRDCSPSVDSMEGPCQVSGYESAVRQLVVDGLVDHDRVGIVGFSRTCYYVLEALTTSSVHFRAAEITSGVDEGYVQYLANVDTLGNALAREADSIIGSRPFGEGLQKWLKRSPLFNMDKVSAPLLVVASGRPGLLFEMMEPYAALRYLGKPVELTVLREGTHVLTNPGERMVSQGGTVDWFRFWLKGEEDQDPSKALQYARWARLRQLQGRLSSSGSADQHNEPLSRFRTWERGSSVCCGD